MKTRRRFIQHSSLGLGSAALLPFVQRAQAEAEGNLPRRFVFVVKSSGLTPSELVPPEWAGELIARSPGTKPGDNYRMPDSLKPADKRIDRPLGEARLPQPLAALEPFRERVTVLQGLSGKMCKGGHSSWYGALGCWRTGGEHNGGRPISPTIDGLLAQALPAIFPHVGLAISGRLMGGGVADSVVYPGISAMARDRPIPYQASPMLAYQDLFGIAASGKDAKSDQALKGTLLDFISDDIVRLQHGIGAPEKEKLDHYLEAFDALRDRRRRLKGVEAKIRANAPEVTDKFTSKVETDRIEAQFDLAAASLITGLTNVAVLRPDALGVVYTGLGINRGVHGIGHGESVDGMTSLEARNRIRALHVDQIARLAGKLDAVPEGDGTMLDNTLIIYLSDAAEKHHATCIEWPYLLVGGNRGMKINGRYIQYPAYGKPGHRTIATLYQTLLHAVGKPQDRFGQDDLKLDAEMQTGPLAELLA